jgi:hypothetical protein
MAPLPDNAPPADDQLLPDRKKRAIVRSIAIVSSLLPIASRHERRRQALELAKARDVALRLPESGTMVQLEHNQLPSSPERYFYSNDYEWENYALSKYSIDNKIQTAFRAFLECFYGICVYVPYWDRNEESSVTVSAASTSRDNRRQAVEQ